MPERRRVVDGRGRVWTVAKVAWEDAQAEDFRFWYEGLTPEERVEVVAESLEGCLKTRGRNGVPRLRRVHRRIKRPWGAVSADRRAQENLPSSRHSRQAQHIAMTSRGNTSRGWEGG